jgi:hypothetical protein
LEPGDVLLVLSAKFQRRLAEGEKYSLEEVTRATYEFVAYVVIPPWRLSKTIHEEISEMVKEILGR